jgi:hypothetical protein
MSSNDESTVQETIRTVTPEYVGRPNREMNTIGWSIFLGMAILLLPLLPFMIIVWVIARLTAHADRRVRE